MIPWEYDILPGPTGGSLRFLAGAESVADRSLLSFTLMGLSDSLSVPVTEILVI
jgi:hypothetical protein